MPDPVPTALWEGDKSYSQSRRSAGGREKCAVLRLLAPVPHAQRMLFDGADIIADVQARVGVVFFESRNVILDLLRSVGLGDLYKEQVHDITHSLPKF